MFEKKIPQLFNALIHIYTSTIFYNNTKVGSIHRIFDTIDCIESN